MRSSDIEVSIIRGEKGRSAYQIAVDSGYIGTESEWLASLKGDRGEQGVKGDKGDKGERGLKGDTGEQGLKGNDGIDGKSAYQIALDNGYVGSQAEWLASLKGNTGEQGIQGEKGEKGNKGDKGDKGESGYTPQKGIDYFTQSDIEEIEQACTYDDTALSNRVTNLENTIGTLNDSLEGVLEGNV